MKVIFIGAYYYEGPLHHIYRVFQIYKAIGDIFSTVGIEVKYFVKFNAVIPLHNTIKEQNIEAEIDSSDLVFIWNGSQSAHLIEPARAKGIPIYYSELGWLPQNGTFYFDRKGVNYESSITDWVYSSINDADRAELNTKLAHYHQFIAKKTGAKEEDFIFVPLQVEDDTQITRYSPRFKKMQDIIDYVCAYAPGKIVFKTHPKHRIEGLKIPNRCKLYTMGTTHDFLPDCKYVITINSTVGIEALSYYKPVITLGNALYESRQLTWKAEDEDGFKAAIEWAEKGESARGIIEAFLSYLFKRQWYMSYLADPKRVLGLIEGITDLNEL